MSKLRSDSAWAGLSPGEAQGHARQSSQTFDKLIAGSADPTLRMAVTDNNG
jgi:hypothetical protein